MMQQQQLSTGGARDSSSSGGMAAAMASLPGAAPLRADSWTLENQFGHKGAVKAISDAYDQTLPRIPELPGKVCKCSDVLLFSKSIELSEISVTALGHERAVEAISDSCDQTLPGLQSCLARCATARLCYIFLECLNLCDSFGHKGLSSDQ
jgi:hypothetical protein